MASERDLLQLRELLDEYLRMYAGRDDALTARFSEDFSGFTGGGDVLVKDRARWVEITRTDFAQVKEPIRLELGEVSIQSLAETVAVATAFFSIHLPVPDRILSRETARLVLVFRREAAGWRIAHSSISIPYRGVKEGEVYPLEDLARRNRLLGEEGSALQGRLAEVAEELRLENAERRRAEAKLRESEALYRSILDASPDDITVAGLDGRITMVSSRAVSMFAYPDAATGVGRHVTDFIVPEDRPRAAAKVALMFQGTPPGPSEYRGLRHDGTVFDIEVNTAIIPGPDGRPAGFVVVVRDATARKAAEAALKAAQDQLRTLRGLLPICMHCKKIRDAEGSWSPVEVYVRARTEAEFSHGLCPECLERWYPQGGGEGGGGGEGPGGI